MDDEEKQNHLEQALAQFVPAKPVRPAQYLFLAVLVGAFELSAVICAWLFLSSPAAKWVFTNWRDLPYILDYVTVATLFGLPVFVMVKMHSWLHREFDFL